jgi:hypothetical protein
VHLIYIIEHRTRIRVLLTWVWSFLTYARGAGPIASMDLIESWRREARQLRPQ